METNLPYLPPGSPTQYGFAGISLDYPGHSAIFMQAAAPEPPCLKRAADGSCQFNVYQAALLGGIALALGIGFATMGEGHPKESDLNLDESYYVREPEPFDIPF